MDFSQELLREARAVLGEVQSSPEQARFIQGDLSDPGWPELFCGQTFDGALAFAVLHHIPGYALRQRILQGVGSLLPDGGVFIHSEWQFHHSPRWLDRRLPWSTVGLAEADLEEGDTLLDWRHALPDQEQQVGLRYVHLFSSEELSTLAAESGFTIVDEFSSDGKEGNLGLYQVWVKQGLEKR
jgi:SAM-dependent methyltransferase